MFLFWDNSNIHYSGLNAVFPLLSQAKNVNSIGHTLGTYLS